MLVRDRNIDIATLTSKQLSRLEENLKELANRCEDDVSPSTGEDNLPAANMIQEWHSEQSDHKNDTSESFIKESLFEESPFSCYVNTKSGIYSQRWLHIDINA